MKPSLLISFILTCCSFLLQQETLADSSMQHRLHQLINDYRRKHKQPALALDPIIIIQAKRHSQDMAQDIVPFSHHGFKDRVSRISQQLAVRSAAENVATNYGHKDPVRIAFDSWLTSPGHRKNILNPAHATGIGISRSATGHYFFTQIFIEQQ